jgi:hypothetical protein
VKDPELAVLDDHGGDLAAMDVAEVDLDSGDHHAALAGDHDAKPHPAQDMPRASMPRAP